jgi:uncharacterized repeat protein (TIGR02543 family)
MMNIKTDPMESGLIAESADKFQEGDFPSLIKSAVSGDVAAFVKLCCDHTEEIYKYIFYQVRNQETAEELVTEIFLEAFKKRHSYKLKSDFSSWLYQIAYNYMTVDPRFFSTIPFEDKQIVLLKFILGLNNGEISRIIGKKLSVVKYRQTRALLRLSLKTPVDERKIPSFLCQQVDDCLMRITLGESIERCLFQYGKMRDQIEPLVSLGLLISKSNKINTGNTFKEKLTNNLNDRLQILLKQEKFSKPQKSHLKAQEGLQDKTKGGDSGTSPEASPMMNVSSISPSIDAETTQAENVNIDKGKFGFASKMLSTLLKSRLLSISLGISLVVVIAAVLVLSGGLQKIISGGISASICTVAATAGDTTIQLPGDKTWQKAAVDTALPESAGIKTGASSQASLKYADGSQVYLDANTELGIVRAQSGKSGAAVTVIKQSTGKITCDVIKFTSTDSRFEIDTPSAVVTVKGTKFSTEIKPDGSSVISVSQGTVNVSAQGKDVAVNAGNQVTVQAGKAPQDPTPTPAATPVKTATPTLTPTPTPTPTPAGFSLTLKITKGGKVTLPPASSSKYPADTVIDLVANADSGYVFSGWTGDVANIADAKSANTTIIIKSNVTVTANFVPTYTLTIRTLGGSITAPGESTHDYPSGTVVNLNAVPDAGYEFVTWTGDVGSIADPKSAVTTITVKSNCKITANFIRIYKLTVANSLGGLVVKPGDGTFIYREGTSVDIRAIPDGGYLFAGWTFSGNTIADASSPSTKITIDRDATLTAKFIMPVPLTTLVIKTGVGGTVTSPGIDTFTCKKGSVITLHAEPNEGYGFLKWTGDISTISDITAADTDVTVNGNITVTANFINAYKLTVTTGVGGVTTQPGGVTCTYNSGTIIPLKATPISGYRFVNWTGDVQNVADPNSADTTITITGDATITANFVKLCTLNVNATEGGTVNQPGVGAFPYSAGTVVPLVAVANTGYTFVNWTVDSGTVVNPNSPTTTITITDNQTVTAHFQSAAAGN